MQRSKKINTPTRTNNENISDNTIRIDSKPKRKERKQSSFNINNNTEKHWLQAEDIIDFDDSCEYEDKALKKRIGYRRSKSKFSLSFLENVFLMKEKNNNEDKPNDMKVVPQPRRSKTPSFEKPKKLLDDNPKEVSDLTNNKNDQKPQVNDLKNNKNEQKPQASDLLKNKNEQKPQVNNLKNNKNEQKPNDLKKQMTPSSNVENQVNDINKPQPKKVKRSLDDLVPAVKQSSKKLRSKTPEKKLNTLDSINSLNLTKDVKTPNFKKKELTTPNTKEGPTKARNPALPFYLSSQDSVKNTKSKPNSSIRKNDSLDPNSLPKVKQDKNSLKKITPTKKKNSLDVKRNENGILSTPKSVKLVINQEKPKERDLPKSEISSQEEANEAKAIANDPSIEASKKEENNQQQLPKPSTKEESAEPQNLIANAAEAEVKDNEKIPSQNGSNEMKDKNDENDKIQSKNEENIVNDTKPEENADIHHSNQERAKIPLEQAKPEIQSNNKDIAEIPNNDTNTDTQIKKEESVDKQLKDKETIELQPIDNNNDNKKAKDEKETKKDKLKDQPKEKIDKKDKKKDKLKDKDDKKEKLKSKEEPKNKLKAKEEKKDKVKPKEIKKDDEAKNKLKPNETKNKLKPKEEKKDEKKDKLKVKDDKKDKLKAKEDETKNKLKPKEILKSKDKDDIKLKSKDEEKKDKLKSNDKLKDKKESLNSKSEIKPNLQIDVSSADSVSNNITISIDIDEESESKGNPTKKDKIKKNKEDKSPVKSKFSTLPKNKDKKEDKTAKNELGSSKKLSIPKSIKNEKQPKSPKTLILSKHQQPKANKKDLSATNTEETLSISGFSSIQNMNSENKQPMSSMDLLQLNKDDNDNKTIENSTEKILQKEENEKHDIKDSTEKVPDQKTVLNFSSEKVSYSSEIKFSITNENENSKTTSKIEVSDNVQIVHEKVERSLNTPIPPVATKNPFVKPMSAFSKSVAKIQYLLMGGLKPEGVFSDDEESSNNSDNIVKNVHNIDPIPTIIHRSPRKTARRPPTIPKMLE